MKEAPLFEDAEKKVYCHFAEMMPLSEIVKHRNPKNRNKHSKEQIKRLAMVMKSNGVRHPIHISTRSDLMSKGHGRLEAALYNSWTTYPIVYEHYDSADAEYQDSIADNATALWAELDFEGINLDIPELGPFDIDLLGIKDFVVEPADKYNSAEDEIPEVKDAITKPGDLWILGSHRLLCGDSTDSASVARLMNGEKADMVYTDPPYGVEYDESWREAAANHFGGSTKGQLQNDDRADWEGAFLLFQAPVAYVWHASSMAHIVRESLIKANYQVRQQIIWRKPFGVLSRQAYNWEHEPAWYCVLKGCTANWAGDNKQTTVWDAENPNHCMSKMGEGDTKTGHPTMKPVKLATIAIQNHKGSIVADPFLGSGSTLIACEKTNRRCFGMEIDPIYIGVILDRWCKFTGNDAYRVNEDGSQTAWSILSGGGEVPSIPKKNSN